MAFTSSSSLLLALAVSGSTPTSTDNWPENCLVLAETSSVAQIPIEDYLYPNNLPLATSNPSLDLIDLALEHFRNLSLRPPTLEQLIVSNHWPFPLAPELKVPVNYEGIFQTGGSSGLVKAELPGTDDNRIRYRIFGERGKESNRVTNGILEYDISGRYLSLNGHNWSVPKLSLNNVVFGSSTLPALLEQFNRFPETRNQLEADLNNLVSGISNALQERRIEAVFDWGAFFRETLPKYTTPDGLLEGWDERLREEVKKKAEEFYGSLNDHEKSEIDASVNNFKQQFTTLQTNYPLAKTMVDIFSDDDPFRRVRWGDVKASDMYDLVLALGPQLVEVINTDGRFVVRMKRPPLATVEGHSASSHTLRDNEGKRFDLTNDSQMLLKATGDFSLEIQLSEGVGLENVLPSRYRQEIELARLLLGKDPTIIDAEASAKAHYIISYWSDISIGRRLVLAKENYELGMGINDHYIYTLDSWGKGTFEGRANSRANVISAEFDGWLTVQQALRKRQEVFFTTSGNRDRFWYTTNAGLAFEQITNLTEIWQARLRYLANYQGVVQQNESSATSNKKRQTDFNLGVITSARGGLDLELIDLYLLGKDKHWGGGFLLNNHFLTITGEASSSGEINAVTRIPIIGELDPKKSKEHQKELQRLRSSPLSGTEALMNDATHHYNLAQRGLFINAALKHFLENHPVFPRPTEVELGFMLADQYSSTIKGFYLRPYGSISYVGDFRQNHGFNFSLGSEHFFAAMNYALNLDEGRGTNTTVAGFSSTIRIADLELVQSFELFPEAQDQNPRYERWKISPENLPAEIRVAIPARTSVTQVKEKREGNFRIWLRLQGNHDTLEDLLKLVPAPKIDSLEVSETAAFNFLGNKNHQGLLTSSARIAYHLGRLRFQHQLSGNVYSNQPMGGIFLTEISYDLIKGIGPGVVTANYFSPGGEDYSYLLPGIIFMWQDGANSLSAALSSWYKTRLHGDVRAQYVYNDPSAFSSVYLKAEAKSYASWRLGQPFVVATNHGTSSSEKLLENIKAQASLYAGFRIGLALLTAYGSFTPDRGLEAGLMVGLDLNRCLDDGTQNAVLHK